MAKKRTEMGGCPKGRESGGAAGIVRACEGLSARTSFDDCQDVNRDALVVPVLDGELEKPFVVSFVACMSTARAAEVTCDLLLAAEKLSAASAAALDHHLVRKKGEGALHVHSCACMRTCFDCARKANEL